MRNGTDFPTDGCNKATGRPGPKLTALCLHTSEVHVRIPNCMTVLSPVTQFTQQSPSWEHNTSLVKKLQVIYGTWNFIIVFTKANTSSWHVPEESYFFETPVDIFLPSTPRYFFLKKDIYCAEGPYTVYKDELHNCSLNKSEEIFTLWHNWNWIICTEI